MTGVRALPVALVLAPLIGLLAGCGGGESPRAAARVGGVAVTKRAVAHWMTVLAPEREVPDAPRFANCAARHVKRSPGSSVELAAAACRREYASLRSKALELLISAQWLSGAARERGVAVSAREVREGVARRTRALGDGAAGLRESLQATGQTVADVELEVRAERAAARLREQLARSERPVAAGEVEQFYRRHLARFTHRERRRFYIVEALRSHAEAERRKHEIERGLPIASTSLQERLERAPHQLSSPQVVRAIFTGRLGRLSDPVDVKGSYYLIEVDRIVPAGSEPLARVRPTIERELTKARADHALTRFLGEWRQRWTAKTHCEAGYLVTRCGNYPSQSQTAYALELA